MTKQQLIHYLPVVCFVGLLLLQSFSPKRASVNRHFERQGFNLLLFAFNALVLALLSPLSLIAAAMWADTHHFGLLNQFHLASQSLVFTISTIVASYVVLDFAIYIQHIATHKFNFLWQFHQLHHRDSEVDVTTALRFHLVELVFSIAYKAACIMLLGVSIASVIVFELLLLIGAQFSHSNWRLPSSVDSVLRLFIVTPDVHRIHHSVDSTEHDTNYGFCLIWWDKVFKTYTQVPRLGHQEMEIGLKNNTRAKRSNAGNEAI